ncbi:MULTISPECIES: hypothetical protein, partial [unclassified Caballeronia]|uniref:hypothetical protein n=1 Tax=unclassified Caballeronia TaxID=2646786 RepID=UPI002028C236
LSPIPKNQPHSPSSAHTYRLLVFKEHIARQALLQLPSCVAASAAEKRDYEERLGLCQQEFEVSFSCRSAPGAFYNLPPSTPPIPPSPASFAFIESRRNEILVSGIEERKRFLT